MLSKNRHSADREWGNSAPARNESAAVSFADVKVVQNHHHHHHRCVKPKRRHHHQPPAIVIEHLFVGSIGADSANTREAGFFEAG
jgi:hypothetical protein